MSTAPESQPDSVDPSDARPPFYRRPLALIIAGVVVLLLIIGGILTAVAIEGKHPAVRLAAGSTSRPSTATSTPTQSATPTPTPTASADAPQPQAGASAPTKGSGTTPAAPVAPVAPVAPAPAPPVTTGPGRTAPAKGVSISSFTGTANTNCPASPTANSTFAVTITWVSSGGTSAKLRDGNSNLTYPVPVSGSKNFSQVCTEGGGVDIYYLTVSTTSATANPKSVLTNWTMAAHFTN